MSGINFDNMPAGREMDALVAEKVMGWSRSNSDYSQLSWNTPAGLTTWELTSYGSFRPSTDIEAAWQVVEKLRLFVVPWGLNDGWAVADKRDEHLALHIMGIAPTAPLAICRAALNLKALEAQE